MDKQEKKSRRVGALTSLTVHALLLLIFFFASGYRAPYPPAPEYGVIVNMGFDDQGTGDIQTDQPVATPDVEQQKPEEQPAVLPDPAEQKPEQKDDDQVLASNEESPVSVKKEEEKPKDKPKEEVIKPKETPKEETKPKETEKLKTEYKPDATTANNNSKGTTTSEGDDVNKTGNKGQSNGTLDPEGLYKGTPGGGGGGNGNGGLSMSGWAWTDEPRTSEISNSESGRIVFEIECDESGEITGIKTLETGVSAATEQILRREIMRTSLTHIGSGAAPARSKGKMTFVIKSR